MFLNKINICLKFTLIWSVVGVDHQRFMPYVFLRYYYTIIPFMEYRV